MERMTWDVAVISREPAAAAPLLASLQRHGLRSGWLDLPELLERSARWPHHRPEVLLLLDGNLLAPLRSGWMHQEQLTELPLLVLVEQDSLDQAPALLAAGACDVWSRTLPEALLVRRLQLQIQLKRQERALAKQLRYEAAVAACARLLVARGPHQEQHLQRVVELLQTATAVSRAYLFRNHHDPEHGLRVSQLHEACAAGIAPQIANPQLQDQPFAEDAPNALKLLSAGEPFVGLVEELPEPERQLLSSQSIVSVLILPIFADEQFWGFMGFDDCVQATTWQRDEIALLRIVAETVGLAIERNRAERELYRMAIRDALTGLYNRRYLGQQLDCLVNQARRQHLRFAIAILDLDWFKQINDSHGHPVGDQVLCHFARALEGGSRPYDLVGRYGGEEFLLVLLHAGPTQLNQRLERLRRDLESSPLVHQGQPIPITFSAGLAGSTELAGPPSAEALVALADRRLYRAKEEGRNRSEVTGE